MIRLVQKVWLLAKKTGEKVILGFPECFFKNGKSHNKPCLQWDKSGKKYSNFELDLI
jgi:hypothetical protein